MSLKIAMSEDFSSWLQSLRIANVDAFSVIVKALLAIAEENVKTWESAGDIKQAEYEIHKLPDQSPALYRIVVIIANPRIAVLYGLLAGWVVPAAWGELKVVMQYDMVKSAHELIDLFKESGS